jgi:hypothetical protein
MYFNHHISKTISKREPTLEPFILEYPKHSYFYAKQVLKAPWKLGEKTILGGEETGTIEAEYVYLYAKNLLKSRWKEGERALLKMAKDIGNWRCSEARDHLAIYAKNVIKGRWKEAEPLIAQSKNIGVYFSILNDKEIEEFRNMITLEAIGGAPASKKFFSWKPTHKVKMKGSKAFDIMLDPDHVEAKVRGYNGRDYVNKQNAYKLSEWLYGDPRTDIAFLPSTNQWLWKSHRHYQKKILEGTVTPIG